jgi:hypothetical protein
MACDAGKEGKAVWNLGVLSFSPVIYYRKTRAAAERLGIKPTEIYVFLDMSDITDEALVYRESEDGTITMAPSFDWFDTGQFLLGNFATFRLLYNLWSLDPRIMDEWGRRGLELAGKNLDKIVDICREWKCQLTLVTTNSNPDGIRSSIGEVLHRPAGSMCQDGRDRRGWIRTPNLCGRAASANRYRNFMSTTAFFSPSEFAQHLGRSSISANLITPRYSRSSMRRLHPH